jgi:hypothetical protein
MIAKLPELYVAVDVEADGPIPGPYSMLSLGMAVVGHPDLSFYTELKPISAQFVAEALAVSGLDRNRLVAVAPAPEGRYFSRHPRSGMGCSFTGILLGTAASRRSAPPAPALTCAAIGWA